MVLTCDVRKSIIRIPLVSQAGTVWTHFGGIINLPCFPKASISEPLHCTLSSFVYYFIIYFKAEILFDLLGDPPMDEVEILRGQVKLLHNQLLFERHKCDLHAIRNRRLIGKTFKAAQYHEELLATVSR